jgi:hypothetical protein
LFEKSVRLKHNDEPLPCLAIHYSHQYHELAREWDRSLSIMLRSKRNLKILARQRPQAL